jgi:two-component system chemotaxis response regulator CheB
MISSLTTEGSAAALTALRNGASDVIAKDLSQVSLDIVKIEAELTAKVRAIATGPRSARGQATTPTTPRTLETPRLHASNFDLVAIGSSTGGPPVLEKLVPALPGEMPLPVVIAQHMPLVFTKAMSARLNDLAAATVVQAEQGMPLERGHVYIAPGGSHVRIRRSSLGRYRIEVSGHPADALYKPAVNELFASAARACGRRCLAMVLTGMGDDGLVGGRELHAAGATLLAQEASSCVVYGMPKVVTEAGLTAASLDPDQLLGVLSDLGRAAANGVGGAGGAAAKA